MAYDEMGNYGGYDDSYGYDTMAQPVSPQFYDDFGNPVANAEEEKRKREEMERQIEEYKKQQEQLGSEVSHKQEVTTYADGSRTITTKQEVPGQRAKTLQPVSPDYNQRIAQQESGANPNVGYHDQTKSSAYGPYGITQGAYADARRANPNLPEDIRQANPEQMTAAQNAVTGNNAKYLQNYGVPVNDNTLQAAHFLGAKGLSDYLKTGYISPQAAAANGGIENVKRIVDKRLGGQAAPASGAVQPVQPQQQVQQPVQQARPQMGPVSPEQSAAQDQQFAEQFKQFEQKPAEEAPRMAPNSYDEFGAPVYSQQQADLDSKLKSYESIQNDPKALMNFEGPEWMQNNAKMRAADIMANERDNQKAQEKMQTATETELARYLQGKTKSGEDYNLAARVRAMLFSAAGNKELAMREMNKLDTVGTDKYVQGPDGKAYLVRVRADGEVMNGFSAETQKQLTPDELVKVSASIGVAKGAQQHGTIFNDPTGQVKGSWVLETRPGSTPVYKEVGTGRVANAEESTHLAKVNANKDALQTARTQATHAYTNMLSKLNKDREQLVQLGASEADLAQRGLDEASIQRKANAAGQNVMSAATSNYGVGAPSGRAPAGNNISISTGQTKPTDMPAVTDNKQAAAGGTADTSKTPESTGILANWEKIRPGEDVTNFKKRSQYNKEDIEAEAQQLVNGDKTLTEITGRDAGLLRHYASARAKEIDPTWSATDSNARRDALKKWTNPDSQVSKQVRSHITAANSIQDVKDAFEALKNGNTPLFNQIKNDFEKNTGKPLPISAETGAMMLGPEIIKSIIPNGGGVAERLEAKHMLNTKLSPAQAKAVFEELELFQGNSLKALETDWVRAKLPKEQFRNRVLEGSPAAQELYDRSSKHQADRAAGRVGLQSAPDKAAVEAELRRRGLIK